MDKQKRKKNEQKRTKNGFCVNSPLSYCIKIRKYNVRTVNNKNRNFDVSARFQHTPELLATIKYELSPIKNNY